MLDALKHTKQPPRHHPEGNVWKHTLMAVNEAAQLKHLSSNPQVLMWSALLHDIGKPETTKVTENKVTSYNHDKVGEKLSKKFLSYFTDNIDFIFSVSSMVRWHMQILFVVKNMPFADIKSMKKQVDIHEVALLGLCDRCGRLNANRAKERENIDLFIKKCK